MAGKIQLYSLGTPNGQKVSIALEEMEIPYDAHKVDILVGEQFKESFVQINPNSKIPAIVDPAASGGKDFAVFESGAILVYLAEKSGRFLSEDPFKRSETLQWLFFQMAGVGPMFGQFGHFFKYAKEKCDHPYPVKRYTDETVRLLMVLENRLKKNQYLAGNELSIADFATMPWVVALERFYRASDALKLNEFAEVNRWKAELLERPATQRGMKVCEIS